MPSPSLVSLALNGESYLVRVITVYDIVPSPFKVHVLWSFNMESNSVCIIYRYDILPFFSHIALYQGY